MGWLKSAFLVCHATMVFFLIANCAIAHETATGQNSFFSRKNEGWWFYNESLEDEELPKEDVQEPKKPVQIELNKKEEVKKTPEVFSSAWLRENLTKYLDLAQDNPTAENVAVYYYLQKIALEKATKFSEMQEMVVMGNPYLDESTTRPFSALASQELDIKASNNTSKLIRGLNGKAGLAIFYDVETTSALLLPTIQDFVNFYEFDLLAINVNEEGKQIKDNPFNDMEIQNRSVAEKMNINSFPAIFLAIPEKNIMSPMIQGFLSFEELEKRILVAATREGLITLNEFNMSKPIYDVQTDITPYIERNEFRVLIEKEKLSGDETGFVPPEKISQYIQKTIPIRNK